MIRKYISAVCIAIFIAVQTALSASASTESIKLSGNDSIFAYNMQQRGVSHFFDGLEYGSDDWTAYCYLKTYGTDGAESYAASVKQYADALMVSDRFVKPTDLQKAAITLSLFNECSQQLINEAVYFNKDFEKQGINAYIWGLIALNCAKLPEPENALNTRQTLVDYILSKQLSDGGYALKGDTADTDITASVIYALLPCEDERARDAASKAQQTLYSMQLENGGFSSMGIENCESSAQAIIALCSDKYALEQLYNNGIIAALCKYELADGSFSHLPDGDSNSVATAQACMALTACHLMTERSELLFDKNSDTPSVALPENPPAESSVPEPESSTVAESAPAAPNTEQTAFNGQQIKLMLAAVPLISAVILLIVFFIGDRKKKALIPISVTLLIIAAVTAAFDIKTPNEYYADISTSGDIAVSVYVNCSAALDSEGETAAVLPADGILLAAEGVSLAESSTAFDALIAVSKATQLRIDYTGTSYGTYINGIGGLYEFDFGSTSGWLYKVNGEMPDRSVGTYILSDGDVVEFVYTVTLGDS